MELKIIIEDPGPREPRPTEVPKGCKCSEPKGPQRPPVTAPKSRSIWLN